MDDAEESTAERVVLIDACRAADGGESFDASTIEASGCLAAFAWCCVMVDVFVGDGGLSAVGDVRPIVV